MIHVVMMPVSTHYQSVPCFAELGEGFFDPVEAARFPQHILRYRNQRHAARIGLAELDDKEWEQHFSAFCALPDNLPRGLALRYHGHQFRMYNPNLGDGRGFLFAQLRHAKDRRLLDLGTKGTGTTPWSRGGDGRLTLKGGVREVLATQMLEALGVYTSKSFSLFETGEQLQRNDEPSPTRSCVLVRLSHSHIRFGSFQRHAAYGDKTRLQKLLHFSVRHYLPEISCDHQGDLPTQFLRAVLHRSADLAASWMTAGFVHGVLNTDNMNITGESFDYGPYRFVPFFDPNFVAAYFDHTGLYAFGRQPEAVLWNLQRLAEALAPMGDMSALTNVLDQYEDVFFQALMRKHLDRLGLKTNGTESDTKLLAAYHAFLAERPLSLDQFFFDWYGGAASQERAMNSPASKHYHDGSFRQLRFELENHAPAFPQERLHDPYFRRSSPCTLLLDDIEAIWEAIAQNDNWGPFEDKLRLINIMRVAYGR